VSALLLLLLLLVCCSQLDARTNADLTYEAATEAYEMEFPITEVCAAAHVQQDLHSVSSRHVHAGRFTSARVGMGGWCC
jgi:hypothetical protein